ncbi:MAG: hypothetical protein ACI87O_002638 [Planctomycetota bacterium]
MFIGQTSSIGRMRGAVRLERLGDDQPTILPAWVGVDPYWLENHLGVPALGLVGRAPVEVPFRKCVKPHHRILLFQPPRTAQPLSLLSRFAPDPLQSAPRSLLTPLLLPATPPKLPLWNVYPPSAVSILIPLANHFEAQGKGHLGVITSVAGERGRPRNYTYGAAKGGLTRYLQGLRSRLYATDVQILNIKLGPADTPMTAGHDKNFLFGEKTKVAQGIVRALKGRKHVVYLKGAWSPIMAIVRSLPEFLFQRFGFLSGR